MFLLFGFLRLTIDIPPQSGHPVQFRLNSVIQLLKNVDLVKKCHSSASTVTTDLNGHFGGHIFTFFKVFLRKFRKISTKPSLFSNPTSFKG